VKEGEGGFSRKQTSKGTKIKLGRQGFTKEKTR
jgi:hypothetical protein